jgi:hypothetical protein
MGGAVVAPWQQIKHGIGRPTELHAERRDNQRPVDEDRMRHHRLMLLAVLIFVATIALVIWQPKGLGIGWSAMGGAARHRTADRASRRAARQPAAG